ncbi:hypothetical protein PILCRDRAFT_3527 [Piloderma croceum F 1598]|uniref:CHAT domain-containing protein n=1 Tax=Piloderma croceum (strain F 1598) TaxID=765440 RepID=A0A0C3CDJ1_PILCF|nr:hypothetical protein PILCRDRAFT_3527 [Piloderma croceum F 1598]
MANFFTHLYQRLTTNTQATIRPSQSTNRHKQSSLTPAVGPLNDLPPEANELLSLTPGRIQQLQSGQSTELEAAISSFRTGLAQIPVQHPERPWACNYLAIVLMKRFDLSGGHEGLNEAIALHREALDLRPPPHPDRFMSLDKLADILKTRFDLLGQLEDLNQSISFYQETIALLPISHPLRSKFLNNLAIARVARFQELGQREDLDISILLHQDVLALRPGRHPGRSAALINLAHSLVTRFEQSGQLNDLDKSISFYQEAIALQPARHPDRSQSLNSLGSVLVTRFEQSNQLEDLDRSISFSEEALALRPAPHPDRSQSLNILANALALRFEQLNQLDDLDRSISFSEEALALRPASHPNRSQSLINLANALALRFSQSGQRADLDKSISFSQDALALRPAPHPDRHIPLGNLARMLRIRFDQSGQREDLDQVTALNHEALGLLPATHPSRSRLLDGLGSALEREFQQSGQRADLDKSISFHEEALALRPAGHPDRSMSLHLLATILRTRFQQLGQREDLERSISFHREALALRPAPRVDRWTSLNSLANALMMRFHRSRQHEDLDQSIPLYREAIALQSAPHRDRFSTFNNLANALTTRFQQSGAREDLDQAISAYYEALDQLVSGQPPICSTSANLGRALMLAYDSSHDSEYLETAMARFRVAVTCEFAPTHERFKAAKLWASQADKSSHASALDAYQTAIELLPRLAMLALDLKSRREALTSGTDGLARNAAACAIRSGQSDKAVELLEEGRAVFWSQALQLRTPMDDLRDVKPELEKELKRISLALETGSLRDESMGPSDAAQKEMSMEQEAIHFRRLNDEWVATVEKVRQLNGFQDFMRPSRLSSLQAATKDGPLVILNTSISGSDALIMTLHGVEHIPLPDLGIEEVHNLVKLIQHATTPWGKRSFLPEADRAEIEGNLQRMPVFSGPLKILKQSLMARHGRRVSNIRMQAEEIFQHVLAVLWVSAVEPIVRSLKLSVCSFLLTQFLCFDLIISPEIRNTAKFMLVSHWTIRVSPNTRGRNIPHCRAVTISDYIVSSYAPTITAALRTATPLSTASFKMLVVIQPETLPYTTKELQKIEAHVPSEFLVRFGTPGAPASVAEAVSHLPPASIAHFAYHGHQDVKNPLDSALILEDGELKVSRIMQQPMPNASLAFLCACETAMGDKYLPDEAMHLGATLLFAGFRGVVATMWSMSDVDGPEIADKFYEILFKTNDSTMTSTSRPDTNQTARALYLAVAKLRAEGVSFARWVPFVHLGR